MAITGEGESEKRRGVWGGGGGGGGGGADVERLPQEIAQKTAGEVQAPPRREKGCQIKFSHSRVRGSGTGANAWGKKKGAERPGRLSACGGKRGGGGGGFFFCDVVEIHSERGSP